MSYKEYEINEFNKRDKELCLIASENYPSQEILDASGSIFQLKYSEGFPNKRYYQGCEWVDKMEQDCIDTCLELFDAEEDYLANVQPNSGASANMIVYNAVLDPNDTVLAPDVKSMGHISHSHPKSFIAKYHNVVTYGVDENGYIDYDEILKLALECKPKLIICGASNYSRKIDFYKFKEIVEEVKKQENKECYLMADIAHTSILCAHREIMSPVGYADFITFTTHKCMAGPRGAVILYKKEFDKAIKLSTIPSLFGGPLQHQIYAKLIGFKWALTNEAKLYSRRIIKNAKMMAYVFEKCNIPIVTGGTDNHLITVDLRDFKISGKQLAILLERCGVICNCNTVPNDPRSFMETSGIRLGTPAITKRGLTESEVEQLSLNIADLIRCFKDSEEGSDSLRTAQFELMKTVSDLTGLYPLGNIYRRPEEDV